METSILRDSSLGIIRSWKLEEGGEAGTKGPKLTPPSPMRSYHWQGTLEHVPANSLDCIDIQ